MTETSSPRQELRYHHIRHPGLVRFSHDHSIQFDLVRVVFRKPSPYVTCPCSQTSDMMITPRRMPYQLQEHLAGLGALESLSQPSSESVNGALTSNRNNHLDYTHAHQGYLYNSILFSSSHFPQTVCHDPFARRAYDQMSMKMRWK